MKMGRCKMAKNKVTLYLLYRMMDGEVVNINKTMEEAVKTQKSIKTPTAIKEIELKLIVSKVD